MTKLKIAFIVNPIAGGGIASSVHSQIANAVTASANINCEIFTTKYQGHAFELASQLRHKFDVICPVGGDGTVNEVVQALVYSECALAIIPRGSGNGFANYLGYTGNISSDIKKIEQLRSMQCDLIKSDCGYAVNAFGLGFDAHVASLFQHSKKRGLLNYAKISVVEYFRFKKFEFTAESSDQIFGGKAFLIALCNNSQWGNNFYISPKSKMDDQRLELLIVKSKNLLFMTIFALALKLKFTHRLPFVDKFTVVDKLLISSGQKSIHLDGESHEQSSGKVLLELMPKALKVYC